MSLIVGAVCDMCGKSDIESTIGGSEIDFFPRNGWLSLTEWEGEEQGKPQNDLHVCSLECLQSLVKELLSVDLQEENPHPHPH